MRRRWALWCFFIRFDFVQCISRLLHLVYLAAASSLFTIFVTNCSRPCLFIRTYRQTIRALLWLVPIDVLIRYRMDNCTCGCGPFFRSRTKIVVGAEKHNGTSSLFSREPGQQSFNLDRRDDCYAVHGEVHLRHHQPAIKGIYVGTRRYTGRHKRHTCEAQAYLPPYFALPTVVSFFSRSLTYCVGSLVSGVLHAGRGQSGCTLAAERRKALP